MLNFNACWFRYVLTAHHIVEVFFYDRQRIFIVEWSGEIYRGRING
jgi:hypothetical protein